MATINIIKGQTTYIDPQIQYADSGWVVDGQYAVHYPCFAGTMQYLPTLPLFDGNSYDIQYVVDNYASGEVNAILGTTNGQTVTANGIYTDTFLYHSGDLLKFYSDGSLRINLLNIAPHVTEQAANGQTFAFNEANNIWVSDYDYNGESIIRFTNKLFSINQGTLWQHDTNPIAGSFYGVKYPATISFVVNIDHEDDKLFYNIWLAAKGGWSAPTLQTLGSNEFPNGMLSRLKKGNFKELTGKLWADVLNDVNDPNFATISDPIQRQLTALFQGRKMQGGWMLITLSCNDDAPSQISSAEIYYVTAERSV